MEDERIVAADLQATLERLGYEVPATVDSGRKAVEIADQLRPDLVLMDIQLKGSLDGVSAAEEIHRRWSIPVVFLTANADEEMRARARTNCPHAYLLKPYRTRNLDATIRKNLTGLQPGCRVTTG